jgi:hypothetical protein
MTGLRGAGAAARFSSGRAAQHLSRIILAAVLSASVLAPAPVSACACGCAIFDVGAQALPSDSQFLAWFRYSYMNQNRNWEGTSKAAATDNSDRELSTSFYTVGADYRVDDDWMVMGELPVYARHLTTTDDGAVFGTPGALYTGKLTDLGDAQLSALYTGLAPDLSTGVSFGVKLPTGNSTGPKGPAGGYEFDRDSLPGTGSTDLMLGAYHTGSFTNDQMFGYFVQGRYQFAVLTRDGYRPGNELDGAAGLTYDHGPAGPLSDLGAVLQIIASVRRHDTGANADPLNSGYRRLLIAPGVNFQVRNVRVYADVEIPIHQDVNAAQSVAIEGTAGQLVAPALYKLEVAYAF